MNESKETIKDVLDGLLSKDSVEALAAIDSAETIRILLGHVASRIEAAAKRMSESYCQLCQEKDAAYDRLLLERDKAIKAATALGSAAALREALETVLENHDRMILPEICCQNCGEDFQLRGNLPPDITRKVKTALAAPARNCDRFEDADVARDAVKAAFANTMLLDDIQLRAVCDWLFDTAEKGGTK